MAKEPLIKGALLLGLSGYLSDVLLTGKITAYIHPRFIAFTWFAVVGFALMGLVMLGAALYVQDRPLRPWLYAVVVLPLLMGFTVPPATFGAELVARQGINLVSRQRSRVAVAAPRPADARAPSPAAAGGQTATAASDRPAAPNPAATPAPAPAPQAPPAEQGQAAQAPAQQAAAEQAPAQQPPAARPAAQEEKVASLSLTDSNMFQLLAGIYETPQRYAGARVEMTGFVFRVEDLAADEVALVRLIVTCHVAHAVPDGFIMIHPDAANLKDDSWFRIRGVFEMGTYQGKETIKIRVTEMTAVEMPKDPYIYP